MLRATKDKRSLSVKRNIITSAGLKLISIFVSLQVVPLTIDYVDPDRYGIWLTISSIVSWLAYFDLGFANGFRNSFTEARATDNQELAREYVSTTYAALGLVFSVVGIITLIVNCFLDWNTLLKTTCITNTEFRTLFTILICIFCVNIIIGVFTMMLTADQKPALSSFINTMGQVAGYVSILLLTHFTKGNLIYLALAFSGVPCCVIILSSIVGFRFSRYRTLSPSFKYVRLSLVKKIIGLGGKFFFIMVAMLLIYQFINIILTRVEGPYAVTQYNVAYKYFNVIFMLFAIILTPFWSATTDAFVKGDVEWIKRMVRKLELFWVCSLPVLLLMVIVSPKIYQLWVKESVEIPMSLSLSIAVYIAFQSIANVYMYILNGIGKVRVQMIIYGCFAIVSIPLMNYFCKAYGVSGILLIPSMVYMAQAVFGRIQIGKLLGKNPKGIWVK